MQAKLLAFSVAMAHAEVILAANVQAEMAQKEQQIQALKAKAKSRSALVPLLMNRVATCKKEVGEEVSSLLILWAYPKLQQCCDEAWPAECCACCEGI